METSFYPNECFVCKTTSSLSRCSRCQLISYCGEEHQKKNWHIHKEFCSVISKLMKADKTTHIFEKLRDCSLQAWINARAHMIQRVSSLLNRQLDDIEVDMLRFPRACFVCHDSRQNNLTNCSRCPLVSFCKDHLDSSFHDEICSDILSCHDLHNNFYKYSENYARALSTVAIPKANSKLPNSTNEYFNQNFPSQLSKNTNFKKCASLFFCYPLSIISTIQKLNYRSSDKLTIHLNGVEESKVVFNCWEILLHFLPNLHHLTLVFTASTETSSTQMTLCPQCSIKKKQLIIVNVETDYIFYIFKKEYKTPNLIVFGELVPTVKEDPRYGLWKPLIEILPRLSCPLAFLTDTEKRTSIVREALKSTFWKSLICFDGPNNFSSMFTLRDWEELEVAKDCQFMIITKAPDPSTRTEKNTNDSQSVSKKLKETVKQSANSISKNAFYAGICHVCKSSCASLPCKRCKMIFYCGSKHANIDWPEHKEICKAFVGLLKENGTAHLYDNWNNTNKESWLDVKLSFKEKLKLRLKRDLLSFEKLMICFPRTCFACHESDLSVLKTCECGVSLCKVHRDDSRHKNLCKDFLLEMKIKVHGIPTYVTKIKVPINKKEATLPPSMNDFLNSYLCLKNLPSEPLEKVSMSERFSDPLTFLYALKKLKYSIPKTMVIHIIGAIDSDVQNISFWKIILYWLDNLQSFKIIFTGMKLSQKQEIPNKNTLMFDDLFPLNRRNLDFTVYQGSYDQFFNSRNFSKPDMIVNYNSEIPKINPGNVGCNWKKTLLIIKQMNVPFMMTALTENWAKRGVNRLGTILGKIKNFEILEKNPYYCQIPVRDVENEDLYYFNNYLVIYTKFIEISDTKKEALIIDSKSQTDLTRDNHKISLTKKNEIETKDNEIKNEVLKKENLFLLTENKMLKENLHLREENERLENEIISLKKELALLRLIS